MRTVPFRWIAAVALLAAGCAGAPLPEPVPPGSEARRHLAALAYVTVENATPRRLRIAFRPAGGTGGEVVIGSVGPDSAGTLAPLPAEEPIVLSAIAGDSTRLVLAPRSFALDERWTWRIPADAAFTAPAPGAP